MDRRKQRASAARWAAWLAGLITLLIVPGGWSVVAMVLTATAVAVIVWCLLRAVQR